jgi:hypothetical protein
VQRDEWRLLQQAVQEGVDAQWRTKPTLRKVFLRLRLMLEDTVDAVSHRFEKGAVPADIDIDMEL